jgi:hypothetical protein
MTWLLVATCIVAWMFLGAWFIGSFIHEGMKGQ